MGKFERKKVRINAVKIGSKAFQGEWILLRISRNFELSEFELSGSNGKYILNVGFQKLENERKNGLFDAG